jgi:hypothetical protein
MNFNKQMENGMNEVTSGFDYTPLSNETHANLKVNIASTLSHLKSVNNTSVVAEEIAEIAADCPVVLLKNEETGKFQLSALLGLSALENLLIDDEGKWIGTYIPVGLEIAPFGFFIDKEDEAGRLQIDMNSTFLSDTVGKALYENGTESIFLQQMREQLELIHDASVQTEALIENLVNRNLIAALKVVINADGIEQQIIGDLYTINVDEFAYMANEDIVMFHQMGYWGPVYAMKQSLSQFKRLASLKQQQDQKGKVTVLLHIDSDDE